METTDNFRDFWQQNASAAADQTPVSKAEMEFVIRKRVKKQRKVVAEFFWVSLSFQILVYAVACFLIVRYWGNEEVTIMAAVAILLYVPFTVIIFRKYKAMYASQAVSITDIHTQLTRQYELLTQFFRFKKGFDLVAVPLNGVIIAGMIFQIFVPGGVAEHIAGTIMLFALAVVMYTIALWFENKKHFKKPLRQFEMILKEISDNR